jgi:hypothetical protein
MGKLSLASEQAKRWVHRTVIPGVTLRAVGGEGGSLVHFMADSAELVPRHELFAGSVAVAIGAIDLQFSSVEVVGELDTPITRFLRRVPNGHQRAGKGNVPTDSCIGEFACHIFRPPFLDTFKEIRRQERWPSIQQSALLLCTFNPSLVRRFEVL